MDIGPVMHADDCVASKVAAVAGRAQIRDFVDLAAATERYPIDRLLEMAAAFDPGLSAEDFADAGRRLDQLSDQRFLRFGLDPVAVAELRRRLGAWPRPAED